MEEILQVLFLKLFVAYEVESAFFSPLSSAFFKATGCKFLFNIHSHSVIYFAGIIVFCQVSWISAFVYSTQYLTIVLPYILWNIPQPYFDAINGN